MSGPTDKPDPAVALRALAHQLYKQGRDDTIKSIIETLSQDSMKDGALTTAQIREMLGKVLESPVVMPSP